MSEKKVEKAEKNATQVQIFRYFRFESRNNKSSVKQPVQEKKKGKCEDYINQQKITYQNIKTSQRVRHLSESCAKSSCYISFNISLFSARLYDCPVLC